MVGRDHHIRRQLPAAACNQLGFGFLFDVGRQQNAAVR